jgi:hypothetical protein
MSPNPTFSKGRQNSFSLASFIVVVFFFVLLFCGQRKIVSDLRTLEKSGVKNWNRTEQKSDKKTS